MPTNVLRLTMYVLIAGAALSAQTEPAPRWSRDLAPDLSGARADIYHLAGVSFLDDERLVVYAVSHDVSQLSSRKSPEVFSPFRLHAWVVDSNSGKTEAHNEWGTRVHDSAVEGTTGGVLVKTGGIVKLYSPDLTRARDLPLALDPNGSYFTSVSVSGRTIAISHYFQKNHNYISHVDVLDADTLRIRRSWDQYPPIFHLSMSDERFATLYGGSAVAIAEFGRPDQSKILLGAMKQNCAAGSSGPRVVSDELVVLRDCNEVLLLTIAGISYSLDPFDGRGSTGVPKPQCKPYTAEISRKTAVASRGRFVGITLPALSIKKPLLAESRTCLDGLEIGVYNLALKKRAFRLHVDPLPQNNYDFALSPDGSKLAVLNDRKVSVYSVPVQSVEGDRPHP